MALLARMTRELKMLSHAPPTGVQVWPVGDQLRRLEAVVIGPEGTPYASGHFRLAIDISDRYPFEPPKVQFVTPIYHPNIDDAGRICLDTLKMPPAGGWRPSINLGTLLAMIRLLLAEPNPDDGLMPDITRQYREDRCAFEAKARRLTQEHAVAVVDEPTSQAAASAQAPSSTGAALTAGSLSDSDSGSESSSESSSEPSSDSGSESEDRDDHGRAQAGDSRRGQRPSKRERPWTEASGGPGKLARQ
mmetsp:Transcript_13707/g.43836  ORF Transcript_13707/g.43836 Transcript_13707/m.43836 type:complete len:247 (+) Transcript_13707:45-785(+)